jgi:hypothetical protein
VLTSFSAKPLSVGYVAVGALANVEDVTGIGTLDAAGVPLAGVVADRANGARAPLTPPIGDPAAAKLLDDGDVAGVSPATATASGFVWADGSAGLPVGDAERATADVSSGAFSCFHQANRGPPWQPATMAKTANAKNEGAVRFMIWMAPKCE